MKAPPTGAEIDEKTASDLYAEFQEIFDEHNKAWLELRASSAPIVRDLPTKAGSP